MARKRASRLGSIVFICMVDVMAGLVAIQFMTMNQGKAQVQAQTYKLEQGIHLLEEQKAKIEADIKAIDQVKKQKAADAKAAAEAEAKAAADKARAEAEAKVKAAADQQMWADRARDQKAELDARKAAYQEKWSQAGSAGRNRWVTAKDADRNYEAVLFVRPDGVYTRKDGLDSPMKDQKRVEEWVKALLDSYDSAYDSDYTLSLAILVDRGGNDKLFLVVDSVKAVDRYREISLFTTPSDDFKIEGGSE